MVVYIYTDGNVKIVSPENIYQGNTVSEITLLTPFPSTTSVSVGFVMPDGTTLTAQPMSYTQTIVDGQSVTAYTYTLPYTVTEQAGEVQMAFAALFTNGTQTSYLAKFEVQESVLPTPPENPDKDTYQLLLQYIQTAMQNAANAQSAAEAAQTAAESAETKAAAAETTAGQANETANAANTTAGQANTKANQAVTTSNNAAATASAANQTAIEAKSQASAAQSAAAQAQEDADAAAKSASASETFASEAADSAEEAVTTAQGAASTANEAKTTADGIDSKATQALSNSEQAVTTANEAKELAEQAVAGAGTEVYVDDALQSRLDFTSDPQTQINDKQTQIDNIESGATKVGSAAQADKLSTARNLKVDLASGEAQSFDGTANAEDIGVEGVLPIANGGTGASDLDSIKVGEAGSADEATKIATARNIQVNLASGNAQTFDGSADATEIGVKGILPVANGGTGATSLANITVGRATADGSGNNIEDTYSKLTQVVRTDSLQALNRKQYENFILNSTPKVFASLQTSEPTWKTVGKLNNYGLVRMTVATTINGVDYTESEFILSVSYLERASITQIGNSEGSLISAIRLRADSSANMFIDLQVSNSNSAQPRIAVWFDVRRNDSSGYFETVDFETFSGNDGDYAITTLALNKKGINTTGGVYQNGSPVLVGAPPTWVTGSNSSLKLPSAGWYLIAAHSGTTVSTGIFYWDGSTITSYAAGNNGIGFVVLNSGMISAPGTFETVSYYKLA